MVIRRRKLLTAAAAAAAVAALGYSQSQRAQTNNAGPHPVADGEAPVASIARPGEKPNILLLCIDDLNDWVGYLGEHPGVYTPNIDRLRAQSYSFNRA